MFDNTYSIIHLIAAVAAIYVSLQRNGGLAIGPFLIALIFPYVYLIYVFLVSNGMIAPVRSV